MMLTLPAVHTLDLVDLVGRWNIPPSALLADFDLDLATLSGPNARLPLQTIIALVERARSLTGEPALGFYLGLKMRISAHGFLGFAAMTAATVRDALRLASRFAPTRTTALSLALAEEGPVGTLTITEHADFGTARDVIVFALLIGLWRIGTELTGRTLGGSADIAFPAPGYVERFATSGVIPGPVRFGQDAHRLVFATDVLDLPLPMADASALGLAREQCERELARLGFADRVSARVAARLSHGDGESRNLDDMARAVGMSTRTLKRHLAAEGTSFSELRDAWVRERSTLLLRQSDLNVEGVAERLGYSDAANFTRAFIRIFGMTPGAWRKQQERA